MEEIIEYPYSDDFMKFDDLTGHYILDEKALLRNGYDIRSRIIATSTINPENVVKNFLNTTSDMVYQYIHGFNVDNQRQDYLIAKIPALRPIIQKAMEYQAVYIMTVGNLYLSTSREDRAMAIDTLCKDILDTVIPEIGVSITYLGRLL